MANKISRRTARESAIKLLFSFGFNKEDDPEEYYKATAEEYELPIDAFSHELFIGTVSHTEEIDARIESKASGWKMNRIARMSLSILRLCTYELLYTEVPIEIAINEAVELAKTFDADAAPSFVNGVLNTIAKEARV